MWLLRSSDDAAASHTFRILPGNIKTIGRATGADFIVDASLVSRLHCRVSAGAAELEVVDLDSTNGTYVNGKRVDRSTLQIGDALGVGEVELIVSRAEPDGRA
jgi:pSer/pThr/pTyr-binding forkhead associated (FHA) protein